MKKAIVILILMSFSVMGFSQAFRGFLNPVRKDLFAHSYMKGFTYKEAGTFDNIWLIRGQAEVTAIRMTRDKETKIWTGDPLSAIGLGLSYGNWVLANGEPYCRISVDALLMTTTMINGENFGIGPGVFVTLWEKMKVGVDYLNKQVGINIGYTIKFN